MGVGKMAGRQGAECWSYLRLIRAALGLCLPFDLLLSGNALLGARLAGQGYRVFLGLDTGADAAGIDLSKFRAQKIIWAE